MNENLQTRRKDAPAYQAERYSRQPDFEEVTARKEARYGEAERESGATAIIGGAAGAAATLEASNTIINADTRGASGAAAIKDGISETVGETIVRPSGAKTFADKVYDKSDGLLKTVAGVAGREIVAGIGHGGEELTDKARGKTLKYGYKAGKYAAKGMVAVLGGSYRIAKYSSSLRKDAKAEVMTGKEARVASLKRVKKSVAGSGTSIKKIIKTELKQGIEDFHGSEDLGIKALRAPKDIYVKTKRAIRVVKATGRTVHTAAKGTAKVVKATAHGVRAVAAGIKKAFSNPVVIKISLIAGAIIVLAALVMAVVASIASIIPSISLKSDDEEITRVYEHITKLDTESTAISRGIEKSSPNSDIDEFHYYVNGLATSAENITIHTNADYVLMYLDTKYDDYAFDKLIYGIFGGTNVKEEVTGIHNALYSYSTNKWKEEIEHLVTSIDPITSVETTYTWTEIIWHMDINVSIQSFEDYLSDNIDTMLTADEQERLNVLSNVGTYTARVELGNPFADDGDFSISSRWGYRIHPIDGAVSKHTGIDIPKAAGTPINNVMTGTVTYVGYDADGYGNYCKVTTINGKKEVLYAHMQSVAVTVGQPLKKGEIVGYVGSTGASTGAHLHLEYSIENAFNTNPVFFLDGASISG